ncbi:I78 family peptidase inhibitor [Oceanibaculum pacificum]|uniref:Peptidase inhibitor I78 family protein n=1 Tax=Oceanibaculum pacificum TaxID=580166 RepID=A0A154VUG3_9PROT|nr:I78 family peptidase inhibitor [Oceanibaculum pacificum]KZD04905.1 hypothetical protein AUP43_11920 [Oceanibaculum pacificum]
MENPTSRRTLLTGVGVTAGALLLSACQSHYGDRSGDDGTPLPLKEPKEGPDQISELIGKPCRVIRPGEAMTRDYRPERVNIFLDAGNRIESITYG